jgi:chaperone required for assembly of F1-ATPase
MSDAPRPPASARRFYKTANAAAADDGFGVALDGRALKTPGGAPFRVPTRALAAISAAEWDAQGALIIPASMPNTQLAFAAIDETAPDRQARIDYVAKFGETDLCCHRADSPAALVARQAAVWDPLTAWGAGALGLELAVVTGVLAAPPAPATGDNIRAAAAVLDDFALTALAQAAALSGSVLIAFALLRREIDANRAFEAAALDDLWSLERWGEDAEARVRLERLRGEFVALATFVAALAA